MVASPLLKKEGWHIMPYDDNGIKRTLRNELCGLCLLLPLVAAWLMALAGRR
jgi:hypothetical protein